MCAGLKQMSSRSSPTHSTGTHLDLINMPLLSDLIIIRRIIMIIIMAWMYIVPFTAPKVL